MPSSAGLDTHLRILNDNVFLHFTTLGLARVVFVSLKVVLGESCEKVALWYFVLRNSPYFNST